MAYNHQSQLTGTADKKAIEEKTYWIINRVLPYPRGWWIGLVGHAEELPRHVNMCREIGIHPGHMIIVERDKGIYLDLKQAAKRFGCRVEEGEFNKILSKFISGYHFSLIDYDGTQGLSQDEIDLVDIYQKNLYHGGILRIVASVRSDTPPEFERISDRFNMDHFYRPIYMNSEIRKAILTQSPIQESKNLILDDNARENPRLSIYTLTYPADLLIFEEYCRQKGLECVYENYRNLKTTMRNIIISDNPKLLRITDNPDLEENKKIYSGIHFREVNIGGHQITKMVGKGNSSTGFYNIDGKIYHGKELIATL